MSISLSVPELTELRPRITVFGVGGAGGNAVNNMIRSELEGVEFVVANTDAQALAGSGCERRIQMGVSITEGLGAGSRPEVGRAAAQESIEEIMDHLSGCHMVFITAGMGGGTGTGAAPVIAQAAREKGILTVGVVTKPFQFEGSRRMRIAEAGIEEFQRYADTLLIIPNQNLFRIANENTTFADAFSMADEVLHSGVRGITDLMVMPGLINLDFADVRAVMNEMGKAMMGTGEASGEKRAVEAAEAAIANPLLDDVSMKGARGVLINITGGPDLGLYEVDEAANRIRSEVDADANIIVGSTFCERLEGAMRVSVVATGIDIAEGVEDEPGEDTNHTSAGWQSANSNQSEPSRPPVHAMAEAIEKRLTNPKTDGTQGGEQVTTAQKPQTSEPATAQAEQAGEQLDERQQPQQHDLQEPLQQPLAAAGGAGGAPVLGGFGSKSFTGIAPASQPIVNKAPQASQPAPEQTGAAQVDQTSGTVPNVAPGSPIIGPGFNVRADSQVSQPEIGQDNALSSPSQADSQGEGQAEAGPRKRGGMTVFEKMMDGVRQARQTNRSGGSVKRSLSPANIKTEMREPEAANSDEITGHQQDLAPTGQGEDTLFDQNDGEEQLEIPAFLRRAN